LFEVHDLKPAAQVLANGPTSPVIMFQFIGAGRVLFHAIDSTWRWRIGAGDTYFARYWGQTIRFLARGNLAHGDGIQITTDRREYRIGEEVAVRARLLDPQFNGSGEKLEIIVDSPGQRRRRAVLRRNPAYPTVFEGSLTDLPAASYEVLVVEPSLTGKPPSVSFSVAALPGELARLEMDSGALSAAAKISRGKFYTIASAEKLVEQLPRGRRVPIKNLPAIPIWNQWWLLATFLAALIAEWMLRKRKGML
jgi:hypothetical protein